MQLNTGEQQPAARPPALLTSMVAEDPGDIARNQSELIVLLNTSSPLKAPAGKKRHWVTKLLGLPSRVARTVREMLVAGCCATIPAEMIAMSCSCTSLARASATSAHLPDLPLVNAAVASPLPPLPVNYSPRFSM